MSEDLIERMTSKLFESPEFSNMVVQLCGELTRDEDQAYQSIKRDFYSCIPKDVGINPYFTLDHTSKLEQIFMQLHPELNTGDSGSIDGQEKANVSVMSYNKNDMTNTTILHSIPEEVSEKSSFVTEARPSDLAVKAGPLIEAENLEDSADVLMNRLKSALTSGNVSLSNTVSGDGQPPRVQQPPASATLSEVRKRMREGETNPYERCILQLNKLGARGGLMTPFEKMQCIAEISSCIKEEVQEFWKGVDVE